MALRAINLSRLKTAHSRASPQDNHMKGYKVASNLPHRLNDYVGRVCHCGKDRRRLGLVIRIEAVVVSWLTGETHYVVTYVNDNESAAQIYLGDEIRFLRILTHRLPLTTIIERLNKLHMLAEQARELDVSGGDFLAYAYTRDYNQFLNSLPKILEKNGHGTEFAFLYAMTNHTLQSRIGK